MMSEAVLLIPPLELAVMVAVVDVVTDFVSTVNVAVDLPAVTLTLAGTVADELLLDNVTETPPAGATLLKVTVPVDGFPPETRVGFNDTEVNADAGVMVSGVVLFMPL